MYVMYVQEPRWAEMDLVGTLMSIGGALMFVRIII